MGGLTEPSFLPSLQALAPSIVVARYKSLGNSRYRYNHFKSLSVPATTNKKKRLELNAVLTALLTNEKLKKLCIDYSSLHNLPSVMIQIPRVKHLIFSAYEDT